MDKYEVNIKMEQIKKLARQKDFAGAAAIADEIDYFKVKDNRTLSILADVYEANKEYEIARDILVEAYSRTTIGRRLAYRLVKISIKAGDLEEAEEFYEDFIEVAPKDNSRHILEYELAKAKGAPIDERIDILKLYLEDEMDEKWAFELAKLYHKKGDKEKCVAQCDDIILWFNDGKYVDKAMELKMLHEPLTKAQQEKYHKHWLEKAPSKVDASEIKVKEYDVKNEYNTVNIQNALKESMNALMEEERRKEDELEKEYEKKAAEREVADRDAYGKDTAENADESKEQVNDAGYVSTENSSQPEAEVKRPEPPYAKAVNDLLSHTVKNATAFAPEERYTIPLDPMFQMQDDGQIEIKEEPVDEQIAGQMTIEEILEEYEEKKAAEEAERARIEAERAAEEERLRLEDEEKAEEERKAVEAEMARQKAAEDMREIERAILDDEDDEYERYKKPEEQSFGDTKVFNTEDLQTIRHVLENGGTVLPNGTDVRAKVEVVPDVPITFTDGNDEGETQEAVEAEAKADEKVKDTEILEALSVQYGEDSDIPDESLEIPEEEEAEEESLEIPEESFEMPEEESLEVPQESFEMPEEESLEVPQESFEMPEEEEAEEESLEIPEESLEIPEESFEIPEEESLEVPQESFEIPEEIDEKESEEGMDMTGEKEEFNTEEFDFGTETDIDISEEENETQEESTDIQDETNLNLPSFEEESDIDEELELQLAHDIEPAESAQEETEEVSAENEEALSAKEDEETQDNGEASDEENKETADEEDDIDENDEKEASEAEEPENTKHYVKGEGLDNEQIKNCITEFVAKNSGVKALDRQILKVLQEVIVHGNANIIVMGELKSGKTNLAIDLVKTINKIRQVRGRKIAKINGNILNGKDVKAQFEKLADMDVVVDRSGMLIPETLDGILDEAERTDSDRVIILEFEKTIAEELLETNERLAKAFTCKLIVKQNKVRDWAKVADEYARKQGYTINEMGVLALHAKIDALYAVSLLINEGQIKAVVDRAIENNNARNSGFMKKLLKKNKERILGEEDFAE